MRGKFKPIATNVNGIQICEHFPLMARMMDKVSLIRSLHHRTGATHENGQRWMMTGHDFNADSVKPHVGSVISRVFGHEERTCPPTSSCPARSATPAPARCTARPPATSAAPTSRSSSTPIPARPDFKVADLEVPAGRSATRLDARRQLLDQLDELQRRTETAQHADARQPPTSGPSGC